MRRRGRRICRCSEGKGAQMYITGEIKHNFYAARNGIILAEAGHFDTEKCFCEGYTKVYKIC